MLSEIEIVVYTVLLLAIGVLSVLYTISALRPPPARRLDAERLAAGGAFVAPQDDDGRLS